MRIDVVSIFPDYLEPLRLSLVGRAIETGIVELGVHDLRDWTHDRHRTVDDTPYGGGAGMVMRPEPWGEALDDAGDATRSRLVVLTPAGRTFTQAVAYELAAEEHLVLACGRYEGIDARVAEDAATRMPVDELSIGDYVLNGGEAAALVVIEAVVRLLPGVIGNPESLREESHAVGHDGLLEGPVYTKPPQWRGLEVPQVLISGHHAKIDAWRREQALDRTRRLRPDLLPDSLEGLVVTAGRAVRRRGAAHPATGGVRHRGPAQRLVRHPTADRDLGRHRDSCSAPAPSWSRGCAVGWWPRCAARRDPDGRWYVGPADGGPGPAAAGDRQPADGRDRGAGAAGNRGHQPVHRCGQRRDPTYYRRRGYLEIDRNGHSPRVCLWWFMERPGSERSAARVATKTRHASSCEAESIPRTSPRSAKDTAGQIPT